MGQPICFRFTSQDVEASVFDMLDNIRRHYQTKHTTSFDGNYPMDSNKEKEKG